MMVRVAGLVLSGVYAGAIVWLYSSQPQTRSEAIGGLASTIGVYRIDRQAFDDGLAFFRQEKFAEARLAFERADPARRDALTQFYVAYSCYREGWGRLYSDDKLFKPGLDAVNRAIEVAPDHRLVVDDPTLKMHSAEELKVELEHGLKQEPADLNPLRLFESRK